MTIQIGLYNIDNEVFEESEELLSNEEFFYFAEILSQIMDAVRESDDEDTRVYREAFFAYIDENREESESAFSSYCAAVARIEPIRFGEEAGQEEEAPLDPQPEEFDSDTRAFLGKLVLSNKAVGPEDANALFQALLWLGIILKSYSQSLQDEDPESVEHLDFAGEIVSIIAAYCEESVEESRAFKFAY